MTERSYVYAVFLHVKSLWLRDMTGLRQLGGAYAWRRVTANDITSAPGLAIESLLSSPILIAEAGPTTADDCEIIVEQIVCLEPGEDLKQKSIVFYIETDEEGH